MVCLKKLLTVGRQREDHLNARIEADIRAQTSLNRCFFSPSFFFLLFAMANRYRSILVPNRIPDIKTLSLQNLTTCAALIKRVLYAATRRLCLRREGGDEEAGVTFLLLYPN